MYHDYAPPHEYPPYPHDDYPCLHDDYPFDDYPRAHLESIRYHHFDDLLAAEFPHVNIAILMMTSACLVTFLLLTRILLWAARWCIRRRAFQWPA